MSTQVPPRLLLALLLAGGSATSVQAETAPPDPLDNPMLVTAGFLSHHQDIQYRLYGMKAFEGKKFDDALRFFRRAGFFADKPSQAMVAEMYWNGVGVEADRALAYVWMDLAAERGYVGFIRLREKYWNALSDAERARALAEGKAIYARFGDAAAKPRYEAELRRGKKRIVGSRTGFNNGVKIEVPGPAGSQTIDGSKFYDERYWDAKKYWAWQDAIWAKPHSGKVTVGEVEVVERSVDSRIPETQPEVDATAPEVPPPPAPTP